MTEPPIDPHSFRKMVEGWVSFLPYREMGFFMMPPKTGVERRILQFIEDKESHITFGLRKRTICIHLDLYEEPKIEKHWLFLELQTQLKRGVKREGINLEENDLIVLMSTLRENGFEIALFVTGVDRLIQNLDFTLFKELVSLNERFDNLSILVFTGVYLLEKRIKSKLFEKNPLAANFFYIPLYSTEDSTQFVKYLEEKWNMHINKEQKEWILKDCSGRLGWIKNAVRLIREKPKITPREITEDASMIDRVQTMVQVFSQEIRKLLEAISQGGYQTQKKDALYLEYLAKLGLLKKEKGEYIIYPPYLSTIVKKHKQEEETNFNYHLVLSDQEYRVFTHLQKNLNTIVGRDVIAERIWESDAEEKYSEWAIDQLLHRVRTKLTSMKSPYALRTKKGTGFILLQK